jgi:hypothetical protein
MVSDEVTKEDIAKERARRMPAPMGPIRDRFLAYPRIRVKPAERQASTTVK